MSTLSAATARNLAERGEEMALSTPARRLVLRPRVGERGICMTVYAFVGGKRAANRRAVATLISSTRPEICATEVSCRGMVLELFGADECAAVAAYFDGLWGAA